MKKKLLLTVMALVCALTCALGLAACNNPADEIVKGSAVGNDYISSIEMYKEDGTPSGILFDHSNNKDSKSKEFPKGKYTIRVYLPNRYGIGDMKMLINDKEVALTFGSTNAASTLDIYKCEYTVTEDFEIKFSGVAERKPFNITVEYIADDWKDRVDSYALQVRLLVNGSKAAAPFQNVGELNSISLEHFIELIADNAITVKADDHVDIYVFSTLSNYKVDSAVLDGHGVTGATLEMTREAFTDDLGRKGYHYQFDVKNLQGGLRLQTSAIKVQS